MEDILEEKLSTQSSSPKSKPELNEVNNSGNPESIVIHRKTTQTKSILKENQNEIERKSVQPILDESIKATQSDGREARTVSKKEAKVK